MKNRKLNLLAGAAAGVMGLTVAGQAMAFDEVNWKWDLDLQETITKTVDITADFAPTGMVLLQDLQVQIGDVEATSTVTGITNNQAANGTSGPQEVTLNGRISSDGIDVTDNNVGGEPNPDIIANADTESNGGFSIDEILGDGTTVVSADYTNADAAGSPDTYQIVLSVSPGDLTGETLNAATELPEVESIATAIANNVSVQSDVMVEMHNTQVAFGDFGEPDSELGSDALGTLRTYYQPEAGDDSYTGNLGVGGALMLIVAGSDGLIEQGTVSAESTVSDILNASVVSNATAVANNKSINIDAVTADDAVFHGDVTQLAYMEVESTSDVSGVEINNYSGLGSLTRPIVSSVATSVGNNLSVTVSSPGLGTPPSTPTVE